MRAGLRGGCTFLVLCVLLALPLSVAAVPGRFSDPVGGFPSMGERDGWRTDGAGAELSPAADLLHSLATEPVQASRLFDLQRAVLTSPPARGGPGLAPFGWDEDVPAPYVYPVLAADLVGDGADELLVAVQPPYWTDPTDALGPITISVKAGSEVGELWSESTWPGYAWPVDVTGDGRLELVVLDYVGFGQYLLVGSAIAVVQRIRVFDGPTGVTLWSASWLLEYTAGGDGVLGTSAGTSTFRNLIVALQLVPDGDGSGSSAVLVGRLDHTAGGASVTMPEGDRRRGAVYHQTFTADLLAGDDGTLVRSSTADGQAAVGCRGYACTLMGGFPWITASPMPVQGGAELVAVTFDLFGGALEIREPDGWVRWRRELPAGIYFPVATQLDGRGSVDILVESFDLSSYETSLTAWMPDGWGWTTSARWWALLGDADGDGGTDVLVDDWQIEARRGATGRTLWATGWYFETPGESSGGSYSLCLCADLDGDGVLDLLRVAHLWVEGDAGPTYVSVVDGATGEDHLVSSALPRRAGLTVSTTDADGDGTLDLVVTGQALDHPDRVRTEVVSIGPTGELWATELGLEWTGREDHGVWTLAVAADLDGDGDAEVAVGILEEARDPDSGWWAAQLDTWVISRSGLLWTSRGA